MATLLGKFYDMNSSDHTIGLLVDPNQTESYKRIACVALAPYQMIVISCTNIAIGVLLFYNNTSSICFPIIKNRKYSFGQRY